MGTDNVYGQCPKCKQNMTNCYCNTPVLRDEEYDIQKDIGQTLKNADEMLKKRFNQDSMSKHNLIAIDSADRLPGEHQEILMKSKYGLHTAIFQNNWFYFSDYYNSNLNGIMLDIEDVIRWYELPEGI